MRSKLLLSSHIGAILVLSLAVIGTTMTSTLGSNNTGQAWADVFEGTEGPDRIFGTPGDDILDSKGGSDSNFGDTFSGDASGDDVILSGEEGDVNYGDTVVGNGSGNDNIIGGDGDDYNTGSGGRDIFVCGDGEEDTATDYNEAEGDIATPDCENV